MNTHGLLRFVLFGSALVVAGCQATEPLPDGEPDTFVTVDGNAVIRTVAPGLIFGANLGAWVSDTKLGATTRDLIMALRPSMARFPGGNISNNFCWVDQKASDNDHVDWDDWSWGTDVGEYLAFLKTIGCVPMYSLNPFDHTINAQAHSAEDEAADLARLFVDEGFPGAYYEVGNENDGSWNPMLSINEYADRFVLLTRAVKTIDPSAQSLGPVGSGHELTWINGFLDRLTQLGATGLLDWICFHHYGGWISNRNANTIDLGNPQDYGEDIDAIRAALASRGLSRVKVAVTELNAAIWDTGCTRDQFTIKQGLWLADALGVSLLKADAVNVWIHLHPGTDPHSLIDSEATPPAATKNYWPVALAAQTLSSPLPAAPVEVLAVARDLGDAVMTVYAVRKADGAIGILLLNKSDRAYDVGINLSAYPQSVTARRIAEAEYAAGTGPAAANATIEARRVNTTAPARSIVALEVR